MKGIAVLLSVLAALVVSQAAVIKAPVSQTDLKVGEPQDGDTLFYSLKTTQIPILNEIRVEKVTYRIKADSRITAVWAIGIENSIDANPQIIAGGIGHDYVTVQFTSARNYGYSYAVSVWGR